MSAGGPAGVTPLDVPGYRHIYSGKVRDLYVPLDPAIDPATGRPREDLLLLVASDRISAFDFVLDSVIPDKGRILTQLSLWWFDQLADLVPNHLVTPGGALAQPDLPEVVRGRAVLVRRLEMVPVECIARAYLTGTGKAEYDVSGSVCGVPLPPELVEASRLPAPIFTPTTKAPVGEHDQPMTFLQVAAQVGAPLADRLAQLTREILARGNEIAAERGILIADTKVEFGLDHAVADRGGADAVPDSETAGSPIPGLVLADEVLTPDSSRFWPAAHWEPGRPQRSYDKQYVRDWLTSPAAGWDRASGAPPPALPEEVVAATRATYVAAYEALTGQTFA